MDLNAAGAVDASGEAWIGFTARTGGLSETHDVKTWSFGCGF